MRYRLYRYWDIIRYDIPNFFRNIKRFRKGLWHFRWYDRHGIFVFLNDTIKIINGRR